MGSYCSCSGSLKYNNDIIIPNNFINGKIEEPMGHFRKEKQEKKANIKRFKTFNANAKDKKPDRKRTIAQKDNNSFISSSSCNLQHKIITNSKISQELINEFYSKYKPLDDNVQVEEIQLAYGDGGIEYRGEWNKFKGERHGRGILMINKEKIYLGYWKNDKMNGLGKQIYFEIDIDNISFDKIFTENKNYSYYIEERGKNHGLMVLIMKENIEKVKNGEKENYYYLMVLLMMGNLKMVK